LSSKIGILQRLEFFKDWNSSKIGILQRLEFFKDWNSSKLKIWSGARHGHGNVEPG
jgi:hypothetical protein